MTREIFYLLAAPEDAHRLRPWNAFPALLSCRVDEQGRLLCLDPPHTAAGGVMAVSDSPHTPIGSADRLCHLIIKECVRRNARGLLLDFDGQDSDRGRLISRLARQLNGRAVTLFIPEYYAAAAPEARVLISSALSGGTLEDRLRDALARFGPDRAVLALERRAEDFPLPAPDGCGLPLSDSELTRLTDRLHPTVWFSTPLCARYFLYRADSGSLRFVLFDDTDTLLSKMETARRSGLRRFLLPWAEVRACPDRFGLSRR